MARFTIQTQFKTVSCENISVKELTHTEFFPSRMSFLEKKNRKVWEPATFTRWRKRGQHFVVTYGEEQIRAI